MSRARVATYALPAPQIPPSSRSTPKDSTSPLAGYNTRAAAISSASLWSAATPSALSPRATPELAASSTRTLEPQAAAAPAPLDILTSQRRDPAIDIDELQPRCKTSRPRQLAAPCTEQLHGYSTQQPAITAARRRIHYTESGVNLAYRTPRRERTGASRRAPRFDLDGRTLKK
ncbi:hypothetical protein OH76DRAFT_1491154 [Lentinus brumalis]|uniref:Uncharacterized protein n=1 Tax=Lentinus brumalis TaxID=2498619 RepID=A0A371CGN6_9APHY|nr:hypothetical protein OH76DRAFT_1491154 [Polyporus brumalis]